MKRIEFWRDHVAAWQRSGHEAADYAAANGLSVQGLRWWRWKLGTLAPPPPPRAPDSTARFVDVVPRAHPLSPFELRLAGGWRIGFDVGVDVDELRRVARALERP